MESSDFIAIQAETIMASLHGQPANHPITLQRLLDEENGVSIGFGELLSQIANQLNQVNQEESGFLSVASDAKNPTLPLPSSDYAKNSTGLQTNSQVNQPKPSSNLQSSSTS